MPDTFTTAAAVELAVVERSGFIESRHSGSAIVLDPDGTAVATYGDVEAPILPRSSLKPLQALAAITAGADLVGEQIAMATASHAGTDRHVALVRDILAGGGLDESALRCPAAWPSDTATRDALVRADAAPAAIRMNCSGKHAAMLRACVANGWDLETYLDPAHPLQVHTREVVERLTGTRVGTTAVDGCGAPIWTMPLAALARGIHRVGTSSERSPFALHRTAGTLVSEVRAHPWVIDGPGRADTVAIERLGVFAKGGAEGVMVMVAPQGTTVALKMLDGSARATTIVALTLLQAHGALDADAVAATVPDLALAVLGGGRPVGTIRATVV